MAEINELVKLVRKRAGLTQQQLADRIYVDRTIIAKVETGKINPSYTLIKQIAKATKSEDIFGLDFSGNEGWRKLRTMESVMNQIKSAMELVNFFRKKARQ